MSPLTRSGSKRKHAEIIDNTNSNVLLLNEIVSLPIIISDYDAIPTTSINRNASVSVSAESGSITNSSTTASDSESNHAAREKWSTGFSDFADDLWNRMTSGMKQKLREACVEVLKRTDQEPEWTRRRSWEYDDDDARLLD